MIIRFTKGELLRRRALLFVLLILFGAIVGFSQKLAWAIDSPEKFCPVFTKNLDKMCDEMGVNECQKALEVCQNYYNKQSQNYQSEISQIKSKKRSLENEIYYLTKRINNLKYKVQKNSLMIKDLNFQIQDTQKSIEKTSQTIDTVRLRLATLLQLRYEKDQQSLAEVFLKGNSLSEFFDELIALEQLSKETEKLLEDIKALKDNLQSQRDSMLSEKEKLEQVQILVQLQKEESEKLKSQKNYLLQKTKGKERLYQQYLKEVQEKADKIRKKIFELAQVSESQSITLEEAYKLAYQVEQITGVRAALLLGLLKVESDIGNNVGQCNCAANDYCRYPDVHWKSIMPKRHWVYFEKICQELHLDPNKTPVSCAVNGGKVQWGGAMGPAQFMPETWWKLGYKTRVERITGIVPANPWRIKDAFLAAGLYLSDFNASTQRQMDEIGAVRAYLCGTTRLTRACRIAGGRSYVYNVMKYANQFQQYIDEGVLR